MSEKCIFGPKRTDGPKLSRQVCGTKLVNSSVRHHADNTVQKIKKIRLSINEIRRNLEVVEKQFWPKNVKNLEILGGQKDFDSKCFFG